MAAVEKSLSINPTKNELVNGVMAKIEALQGQRKLALPPNYSAENALMSAYLKLQGIRTKDDKPVLQACAPESIANSLLDMVIQGLNPAKNQCYFIAYGNQLTLQRSYFGTATVAMRVMKAKRLPYAACVFEGDVFEYEIRDGNKWITKHVQSLKNIDKNKIVAAYCTVFPPEGDPYTEILTMERIKQAWMQSRQRPFDDKGNLLPSSTHFKFTDEMAQKTVISRACKMFINSSDDSSLDLIVESVNRSDDAADEAGFAAEVAAHANGTVLDAEYVEKADEEHTETGEAQEAAKVEPAPQPAQQPKRTTTTPKAAPKSTEEPDW